MPRILCFTCRVTVCGPSETVEGARARSTQRAARAKRAQRAARYEACMMKPLRFECLTLEAWFIARTAHRAAEAPAPTQTRRARVSLLL